MELKYKVNVQDVEIDDWVDAKGNPTPIQGSMIVTGRNPCDTGITLFEIDDGEYGIVLRVTELGDDDDPMMTEQTIDESQALVLAAMLVAMAQRKHRGVPAKVVCPSCHGECRWFDNGVGFEDCERCTKTGAISVLEADVLNLKGLR